MQETAKQIIALEGEIVKAMDKLAIGEARSRLEALQKNERAEDFWQDNSAAQNNLKEQAAISERITPWLQLSGEVEELAELAKLGDQSLKDDLEKQLHAIQETYNDLKSQLKFNGLHDGNDAILSIFAGAGGTDAQDWASMLQRMYTRWAEKSDMKVKMVDESIGEEAGIKSATFEISGAYAFGKLKGEHGVHRLVRLSPFNADNLRQTSFARVEVIPKIDRPSEVEIDEKDLKIDVYRSGGKGGQSVNTTDSAVRITHIPTGISVAIQNERSQLQNKETAMTILRSKLAQLRLEQHAKKLSELKGPGEQAAWGNQIRNYVLHPYKQVKDLRTRYESSNVEEVLNGELDEIINSFLEQNLHNNN